MIFIYNTKEDYNFATDNGKNITSGNIYFIKEDGSTHFITNNISGTTTDYDTLKPSGNIEITENGEDIDVSEYATATVNVSGGGGGDEYESVIKDWIEGDLTSIVIPDGTTQICGECFSSSLHSSLQAAVIPSTVTSIGDYAFNGCARLVSVVCLATTPPTLGTESFGNNASAFKIYVPSASVNTYKTAWSDYASYITAVH